MVIVEKRIAGDWYDLKEASDSPLKLDDLFVLTAGQAATLVADLRLSVEESLVEYKRRCASLAFGFIDRLRYDSRNFNEILTHIVNLRLSIYVTLLQRQLALGLLPSRRQPADERPNEAIVELDVKEILADVRDRVAKSPELQANSAVKNIFMQVSIQGKELANMKSLAPNIPKEKQGAFYDNFRKSFESISTRIREHYAALLAETDRAARPERPANTLADFDLKPLGPLYLAQAKELGSIWSTFSYAQEEGYKTREILAGVPARRAGLFASIDRELREYDSVDPGRGREVARVFVWEIIRILSRRFLPTEAPEPTI